MPPRAQLLPRCARDPASGCVRARRMPAGLRFARAEDAAADPPEFRRILQLQHHAIVLLRHESSARGCASWSCRSLSTMTRLRFSSTPASSRTRLPEQRAFVEAIAPQTVQPEKDQIARQGAAHADAPFAAADDRRPD